MKAIAQAFLAAQKQFSPALKNAINPHFKNKYADLASCVDAVMDALNANGISLIQTTHPHDDGVVVETLFLHESGEQLTGGKLFFPAVKHDAQGYMSALTYCRRGSLMAACGIAPEDDDGNASVETPKFNKTNCGDYETLKFKIQLAESLEELQAMWIAMNPDERMMMDKEKEIAKAKLK
ncbi:MAG: ERF family protein [Cryomorphaceae bacterium]|nr:ERF family protein [Cryomorphaceae bacterium]